MSKGTFNANPTKDFFINMLTKDIALDTAILDLLDNSVDGAKTQMVVLADKAKKFNEYQIEIEFNENEFIIKDNCGGFSKKAAEDYVFRFGKPEVKSDLDDPENKTDTVGRFGVGLKRALFKIGKDFIVETKHKKDHFIVKENVDSWKDTPDWTFQFEEYITENKNLFKLKDEGTYIRVSNINNSVKDDFKLKSFENKLIREIERFLNYTLLSGIKIKVNNVDLKSNPILLLVSDHIKPYYFKEKIEDVDVEIFIGIGEPNPNEAGWYIFCNDRLMVEKDQSNLTGWNEKSKYADDSGVQKFHNKVAMFRGLVFFNSDDSKKLPMTTTKSGIDVNSTLYKTVREKMVLGMKSVLAKINRLNSAEDRNSIVKNSTFKDIVQYNSEKKDLVSDFVFPAIIKKDFKDSTVNVSYRVDKNLIELVKEHTNCKTNGDAGLATFNYYIQMKEING